MGLAGNSSLITGKLLNSATVSYVNYPGEGVDMRTSDVRLFRRLVRSFQRVTGAFLGDRTCCGDLTIAQCHVLLELEEARATAPGTLAARLGLDKSTVSRTADVLIEKGLVSRAADPSDRRYCVLSLTTAGLRKAADIHRTNDDTVKRTFDRLPRDRHTEIIGAFRMLVDAAAEIDREERQRRRDPVGNTGHLERRGRS